MLLPEMENAPFPVQQYSVFAAADGKESFHELKMFRIITSEQLREVWGWKDNWKTAE